MKKSALRLAAGGAFTLSESRARSYASGRRSISYSDPTVLSLSVNKADVALALANCEQDEIVLFPAQLNSVRPGALRPARIMH